MDRPMPLKGEQMPPSPEAKEEHFESIAEWTENLAQKASQINTELQEELELAREVRAMGAPVSAETKKRIKALHEKLEDILETNEEIVSPFLREAYKTVGATGELMLLGEKDVQRLERAMEDVAEELREEELEPVPAMSAMEMAEKQEALQMRARNIEDVMEALADNLREAEMNKDWKSPMKDKEKFAAQVFMIESEPHVRSELERYNKELESIYAQLGEIELNLGMVKGLEERD